MEQFNKSLKMEDVLKMSPEQIKAEIISRQKLLLTLRVRSKLDQNSNKPHVIRFCRADVARLKMVLSQGFNSKGR
jgi:ribosomal protein L29